MKSRSTNFPVDFHSLSARGQKKSQQRDPDNRKKVAINRDGVPGLPYVRRSLQREEDGWIRDSIWVRKSSRAFRLYRKALLDRETTAIRISFSWFLKACVERNDIHHRNSHRWKTAMQRRTRINLIQIQFWAIPNLPTKFRRSMGLRSPANVRKCLAVRAGITN